MHNTLFLFPDWQCFVCIYFYCPQTKLRKGNVFTPVCQSFCSQGGCLPQCILGYTHPPLGRHPPWANTPYQVHAGIQCLAYAGINMATAADGTHPTGMHSCKETKSDQKLTFGLESKKNSVMLRL